MVRFTFGLGKLFRGKIAGHSAKKVVKGKERLSDLASEFAQILTEMHYFQARQGESAEKTTAALCQRLAPKAGFDRVKAGIDYSASKKVVDSTMPELKRLSGEMDRAVKKLRTQAGELRAAGVGEREINQVLERQKLSPSVLK